MNNQDLANNILHVQVHRLLNAYADGVMSAEQVCDQLQEDVDVNWFDWCKWCEADEKRAMQ
jgi:hypothetical protein